MLYQTIDDPCSRVSSTAVSVFSRTHASAEHLNAEFDRLQSPGSGLYFLGTGIVCSFLFQQILHQPVGMG
jgi:hypothetical protein